MKEILFFVFEILESIGVITILILFIIWFIQEIGYTRKKRKG